jgi:hypothetical protein
MRAKATILIIICLLFLVGTVGAVIHVDVTGNSSWLVAGSGSSAAYTVTLTNTTSSTLIQGAIVTFSVDSDYGTMSPAAPASVITNSTGRAVSTFTVNTKIPSRSGIAPITVSINYNGTEGAFSITETILQNIDHNSAYYADFTHPLSGTVAAQVLFNVSLTDQFRNPVDNRRGNHIIYLKVSGPAPNDCGFAEAGFAHEIFPSLDANGNTSVHLKLTTRIGDNNIAMGGYQSIPNQLEWITAEAKGAPVSITPVVSPSGSPPTLPADGTSFFTIIYTLVDVYGNPTNGQSIWINTSVLGEEKNFTSNNLGQVMVKYGPRSSIGEIYINATSVLNPMVNSTLLKVKFKNTGAEIISLTANPDTMPSHDKNPSFTSDIIATVADHTGNAVPGETVTFTIVPGSIIYDGSYNVTDVPKLLSGSSITDVHGIAAVQFRPGGFTTTGNTGYDAAATGHCNVIATWNSTTKIVPVHWKNYPYLSVSTSVTPQTVEINQTIDVTIGFRGDGWAMQPDPIDVILVMDRSGSMEYCVGSNSNCPSPSRRLDFAKTAAKTFVTKMDQSRDQIGVVSYAGYTSGTDTRTDIPLSSSFTNVNNAIDSLNAIGATETREALKQSLDLMIASPNSNPNAKQAIILMTDGDYNWLGNPLGRGTGYDSSYTSYSTNTLEPNKYRYYTGLGCTPGGSPSHCHDGEFTNQNMSIYAKNNNIRLYMIGFASTLDPQGVSDMQVMANATGGFYQYAPDAATLNQIYTKIAGELKDTAGVNVTSVADFTNVNVTGVTMPGNQVFDYVYHPTASTKINWQNGTTTVPAIDQSFDWAADKKLDFTIGTIKVDQSWNATFRLRVNQSGLIEVFGNHSTVTFNGGTETLYLPQTFITVVPKLNVSVITAKEIKLKSLNVTDTGVIKALLPVTWNTTYTGNKTLTEKVYYRIYTGPWVHFDTKIYPYSNTTEYVDFAQLDVTKLPPGDYLIKVYATASDAPDDTIELVTPVNVGNRGKYFIKLQ